MFKRNDYLVETVDLKNGENFLLKGINGQKLMPTHHLHVIHSYCNHINRVFRFIWGYVMKYKYLAAYRLYGHFVAY
jgi:hypothetical protein